MAITVTLAGDAGYLLTLQTLFVAQSLILHGMFFCVPATVEQVLPPCEAGVETEKRTVFVPNPHCFEQVV
jgi:hypothetical protein